MKIEELYLDLDRSFEGNELTRTRSLVVNRTNCYSISFCYNFLNILTGNSSLLKKLKSLENLTKFSETFLISLFMYGIYTNNNNNINNMQVFPFSLRD